MMDCRSIRALVPYSLLPGELTADDTAEIERHLATCADCASWARAERAFDAKVGQAMRDVPVPAQMQENVVTRLAVERGRVWRKQALRVSAAVVAAVVILALGFGWWSAAKIEVSAEAVARHSDEKYVSVQNLDVGSIATFFRSHGVRFQMPPDFDVRLINEYGVAQFDGHTVAKIDYSRDNAQAHVYVLPKRHFKFAKGSEGITPGSLVTVELLDVPGDFLYVVVYVGDARREHFRKVEIVG